MSTRNDEALWLEFIAHCAEVGDRPRDLLFDLIASYLDEVRGQDFTFAVPLTNGGEAC